MHKKAIVKESFFLYIIAGANLFLPILFVPYMSGKIGMDGFGTFAAVAAIAQYALLVVEFGTTTPLVSRFSRSQDTNEQGMIFAGVLLCRFTISLVLIPFILIACINYLDVHDGKMLFFCISGVIGTALNPQSYFQAKGKLPVFSLLNFVFRLVASLFVVFFVESHEDAWMAALFQFFPIFMIAVTGLLWLLYSEPELKLTAIKMDKELFKESSSFLTGTLFSSGYTVAIPLILKAFFGNDAAGVYGVLDRLSQPLRLAFLPILNVVYPKVCSLMSSGVQQALIMARKTGLLVCSLSIFVLVMLLLSAGWISDWLFGSGSGEHYSTLIVITAFTVFFVHISQVFIYLVLVPLASSRVLKRIYIILLVFFVIALPISGYFMSSVGVYITIALTEFLGMVLLLIVSKKMIKSK